MKYLYGVEIECIVNSYSQSDFVNKIQNLGIQVGEDSSIKPERSDYDGIELKTQPLGLKNIGNLLKEVEKICRNYNIVVNDSCGLHVHTSNPKFFNNLNLRKILGLWVVLEDVFFATQPESRLNSAYCRRRLASYAVAGFPKLPEAKRQMVNELGESDRYFALNFRSLRDHGTIECRLHAGTTNSEKIINWIKLLTAFYNYALYSYDAPKVNKLFLMPTNEEKIQKVWELLKLKNPLKTYFNNRIEKFLLPKLDKQQTKAKEIISFKIKTIKEEEKIQKMLTKGYKMQDEIRTKTKDMIHKVDQESQKILKEANNKTVKLNKIKEILVKEFNGNSNGLSSILNPWGHYNENETERFLLNENRNPAIRRIPIPELPEVTESEIVETPPEVPEVPENPQMTTSWNYSPWNLPDIIDEAPQRARVESRPQTATEAQARSSERLTRENLENIMISSTERIG